MKIPFYTFIFAFIFIVFCVAEIARSANCYRDLGGGVQAQYPCPSDTSNLLPNENPTAAAAEAAIVPGGMPATGYQPQPQNFQYPDGSSSNFRYGDASAAESGSDAAATAAGAGGKGGLFGLGICEVDKAKDPITIAQKAWDGQKSAGSSIPGPNCKAAATEVVSISEDCGKSGETAQTMCIESCSSNIKGAAAIGGGLLSATSMLGSNAQKCGDTSKAMDAIKGLLTAFNAVCGGAQGLCKLSCSMKLKSAIEKANATCTEEAGTMKAICSPPAGTACVPTIATQMSQATPFFTAANKFSTGVGGGCGAYIGNLAAGAAGIADALKQSAAAKKCEDQLSNQTPTPVVANVDCTDPANDGNAKCICLKNPRAGGCDAILAGAGAGGVGVGSKVAAANSNIGGPAAGPDGGGMPGTGSDGGAGAGSGGGGGGYGGGAGGGRGGGGPGGGAGAGGKSSNPNLFAGDVSGGGLGGSGGGGGGWGRGGNGSNNPNLRREDLRKLAAVREISGNGKSNWQKVKEAYTANRQRLR